MKKFRLSSIFVLLIAIFTFGSCYNPDDINYKVLIYYNIDNAVTKSLTISIEKDTMLLGRPDTWGNKSWKWNASTGDYGYKNVSDNSEHFFAADENGIYSFTSMMSGEQWDTSQRVTKNLILTPNYKHSKGDLLEYFNVELVYYLTNEVEQQDGGKVYGAPKKFSKVFKFPKRSDGTARVDIKQIIDELSDSSKTPNNIKLDSELGYGYVDWSDKGNGKRYVFYPTSSLSVATLVDNEGNVYEDTAVIDKDMTLSFNYMSTAGFAPRSNSFKVMDSATTSAGQTFTIDTVFVPGNVDDEGVVHPWPYSKNTSGSDTKNGSYVLETHQDTVVEVDSYDVVPDMEVFDWFLDQDSVSKIMEDTAFNNKFKFYKADAEDGTEDALTAKSAFAESLGLAEKDSALPWRYSSYYSSVLMANMLTYLYNKANVTSKGFEPLSYVYYNQDGTVFSDITSSTSGHYSIVENKNSNGFRLMSDQEWEYCAKVITDERQLPDLSALSVQDIAKPFFYEKGDRTGYRHYFRSINDGEYDITVNAGTTYLNYSGSGAGLARAQILNYSALDGILYYDKLSLRTGSLALGRDEEVNIRDFISLKKGSDSNAELDYNTRNGAGLWNMSGFMYTCTSTPYLYYKNSTPAGLMVERGSAFDRGGTTQIYKHRLGFCPSISKIAFDTRTAPRYCRTISRAK